MDSVFNHPALQQFKEIHQTFADYTMIPEPVFLDNLALVKEHLAIEGDFVECGVWKGGMSGACAVLLGKDRQYHLYDSFEGLPEVKEIDGAAAKAWQTDTDSTSYLDNCSAEQRFAEQAMKISGATDVHIHKGWFEKTVPHHPARPIAVLRLDGDWYESTMQCLEALFPMVVPGGIIIIDDYYVWDGCSRALHDYLSRTSSTARIRNTEHDVCYIKL